MDDLQRELGVGVDYQLVLAVQRRVQAQQVILRDRQGVPRRDGSRIRIRQQPLTASQRSQPPVASRCCPTHH